MDVHTTLGAAFIGFSVSIFVFGILSAQVYTYYHRYPLDKTPYKVLVGLLWVLELGHSVLTAHFLYVYTISNWGNRLVLIGPPLWSIVVQVAVGAGIGTIVKGCFAMRVWRFSKHKIWITAVIVTATLVQLGFSIWYTYTGINLSSFADVHSIYQIANVALALGAFTDILTALTLSYYLRKLKTGYQKADSLVNQLILYAINTGILTSTISVACLISYDLMPKNFVFIGCYFVLSKLYANSLMATLNTRHIMKGRGTDRELETVPTFLMMGNNTELPRLPYTNYRDSRFDLDAKMDQPGMQVGIHREVSYEADHSHSLPSPASAYTFSDTESGLQKPTTFYATAW